ncbi:hypothetical protein GM676_30250 [Duganella radicis]|uniref:PAAR domain-containing protein n=1 Tax=Duganella radicis TaxID=551988 RepID=A0A6L6PRX8_9BURK|nr:hypothetical protein [Duganella radicis]
MQRYHITLGASTSAGGKVISASSACSINGVVVALEGDAIFCPACKSNGRIKIFGTPGNAVGRLGRGRGTSRPALHRRIDANATRRQTLPAGIARQGHRRHHRQRRLYPAHRRRRPRPTVGVAPDRQGLQSHRCSDTRLRQHLAARAA